MSKKFFIRIHLFILLFLVSLVSFGAQMVVAQTTSPTPTPASVTTLLSGYAWSSTIGWVSFNTWDGDTVQLSTAAPCSKTAACLTGYAWSPNIGWVKFGGLAGGNVDGMTTTDATVNMTTGAVTGWARVCAGMDQTTPPPDQTTPNNTCTGVSRQDGWDGWIELSGTNHPTSDPTGNSGVTYLTSGPSQGFFTGYAWGGTVVGWLQFNNVEAPISSTPSPSPSSNPITTTCTPSPVSDSSGSLISVTWTAANTSGGAGGPYTYQWPTYNGTTGGTSASQSYQLVNSYQPTVTVTDSSGASANITCQQFTENSGSGGPPTNPSGGGSSPSPSPTPGVSENVNAPLLWIHNASPSSPTSDTACVDNFNATGNLNDCVVQTSVRPGSSVQVSYSWPSNLSGCTSIMVSSNTLPGWSTGGSLSQPGLTTFTNLLTGIYQLEFKCVDGSSPPNIFYSNNIEGTIVPVVIDVSPSVIREQ